MPIKIPAILLTDPLGYVDMTEMLRRGTGTVLCEREDGALVYERESDLHLMTAKSPQTAAFLLSQIETSTLFAAHEAFYIDDIVQRFGLKIDMTCYQAAYLRPEPLSAPAIPYPIRPAALSDAETIRQQYSHDLGLEYIEERIRAGEMFGVYDGDTLAAFAGLHSEGSMGMLEVIPAYRRQHIGEAMTSYLIEFQRSRGRIPFSQVVTDNMASLRMHQKMGFDITESTIVWLI